MVVHQLVPEGELTRYLQDDHHDEDQDDEHHRECVVIHHSISLSESDSWDTSTSPPHMHRCCYEYLLSIPLRIVDDEYTL